LLGLIDVLGYKDKLLVASGTKLLWAEVGLPDLTTFCGLSEPHFVSGVFHQTPMVDTNFGSINCIRPPFYGRAAILNTNKDLHSANWEWGQNTLFDLKGCGVASDKIPENSEYKTGLMTIYDVVQELFIERVVRLYFDALNLPLSTCRALGAALLPFALPKSNAQRGERSRQCALLFREAVERPIDEVFNSTDSNLQTSLKLELLLQTIGLTSTSSRISVTLRRISANQIEVFRIGKRLDPSDNQHDFNHLSSLLENNEICSACFVNTQFGFDRKTIKMIDFGHITPLGTGEQRIALRARDTPFEIHSIFNSIELLSRDKTAKLREYWGIGLREMSEQILIKFNINSKKVDEQYQDQDVPQHISTFRLLTEAVLQTHSIDPVVEVADALWRKLSSLHSKLPARPRKKNK
jgi:hypothetical protein